MLFRCIRSEWNHLVLLRICVQSSRVHQKNLLFVFLTVLISLNLTMAEEHKELKAVLQGNGEFTKQLYTSLAKNQGNVFFSPISIHAILSLASQGSEGQTKEAFTKVLNVPDVKTAAEGYKSVMKRLNSVKDVTLLIANKVFVKNSYKLQESFQTIATQHFFSEVQSLDFGQAESAAKSINDWVEGKTNNKITDLINPSDLTEETRLVLVNAIYFKGKWAEPFNPQNTAIEKFYLNDNDTVDVHMMHIKKKFYFKNDENLNAKVLELPYANKDISLIIILPNERNGIAELEQRLAGTDLTKVTENMFKPEVQVSLPKFKIEQTIDLQDSLTELGLGDIFSRRANLSGMIDGSEPLYVSKVVQKAFIEVNEEGAEAAAATAMTGATCTFIKPSPPEVFTVDHPFILTVQAKRAHTKNVLFKGRIHNPRTQIVSFLSAYRLF